MKNRLPALPWVMGAVALLLLAAVGLWSIPSRPRHGGWEQNPLEGLADFGPVPEFSFIERNGNPVRLGDLAGKVWVVNFIYTTCTTTCPIQSAAMAKLQSNLDPREQVQLVSITVDPERDTPEVLSRYADRFGAHPDRWFFLTGEKKAIYQLALQGFRLSVAPASDNGQSGENDFIHSSRLVLVDGAAKIRGYYPGTDPEALRRLTRDIKLLLNQEKTHGQEIQ